MALRWKTQLVSFLHFRYCCIYIPVIGTVASRWRTIIYVYLVILFIWLVQLRNHVLHVCLSVLIHLHGKHKTRKCINDLLFVDLCTLLQNNSVAKFIILCFLFNCYITSAAYILPSIVCSEPLLSSAPQWKWNCSNLYVPVKGPPDISEMTKTLLNVFKV